MSTPAFDLVPDRYHGVWARTLLETPEGRDTTTWVRWLQTSQWHADLRVPAHLDRTQATGLAQQQGFCGITAITPAQRDQPEICTWHRRSDVQPPRSTPDAGTMVFENADRVIERGVHGSYLEVWERLPGSLGRRIALAALDAQGAPTAERLLLAGRYLMHFRARTNPWPSGTAPDDTLADVVARHPDATYALLDVDISFGTLEGGLWTIERATRPELEGTSQRCSLTPQDEHEVLVHSERLGPRWQVLEWHALDAPA